MKANDLTKGSILGKMVLVALPVLISSIAQMAYSLTDLFWIGRVDAIGIAEDMAITGVGTGGYVAWFAFGLILFAKVGTSVRVAHATGAHDPAAASRHASAGLLVAAVVGLAFSLFTFLFRREIVGLFAISAPEAAAYAVTYVSICGGLLFFQFVSSAFAAIFEGLGRTVVNLGILSIGLVVNMILDPLFILTFRMGVAGAAWATVIAQACTFTAYLVLYFTRARSAFAIRLRAVRGRDVASVLRIGLPAGLQSLFFTSISIAVARFVLREFGTEAMAASRIGSQIEQFTWMIGGGFQTAITVFAGQNFGAKAYPRIRRGIGAVAALLLPYAGIVALAFLLGAERIVRLFVDDPGTVARAAEYLRIISFAQIFMMLESIGAGLHHGCGRAKVPSIAGILGNLARLPLMHLLAPTMAVAGVWWALNLSDAIKGGVLLAAGIVLLLRLEHVRDKRRPLSARPAEG